MAREFKVVHSEKDDGETAKSENPPFLWVQDVATEDEDIRGLPCGVLLDRDQSYPVIRTLDAAKAWAADGSLVQVAGDSLVTLALSQETHRQVMAIARQAVANKRTRAICLTRSTLAVSDDEEDCPS